MEASRPRRAGDLHAPHRSRVDVSEGRWSRVPNAAAQQLVTSALNRLDEARMLLSLLGITTVKMFWIHPKDLLMSPELM
jgi:hypothetical protein